MPASRILKIEKGWLASYFGDEAKMNALVSDYRAALDAHSKTVDVPAPLADPVIEQLVKVYDGRYEIFETPKPPPYKPTPEEVAALQQSADIEAASKARGDLFLADAGRADLFQRLTTASSAQIDAWVDANVTTLAQVRVLLKALLKLLAR